MVSVKVGNFRVTLKSVIVKAINGTRAITKVKAIHKKFYPVTYRMLSEGKYEFLLMRKFRS